jgi:hypothetical protein
MMAGDEEAVAGCASGDGDEEAVTGCASGDGDDGWR